MGWSGHFGRLAKDRRFRIVAVSDRLETNRDRAVAACGGTAFADAGELLGRMDELGVELVVNALPSNVHVEIGLATLAAGRHTVIEKPLAADAAGAERIARASAAAGRQVFVFHNRRFAKWARYLKSVVEDGTLGRAFQISMHMVVPFARRNDWQALRRMNGGLLRNHGTHWFDLALHLVGGPVRDIWGDAKLVCAAGDADDHCKVVFRAGDGCVVDTVFSTAAKIHLPALVIFGTHGTLVVGDMQSVATLHTFDPAAQPPVGVDPGVQKRYQGAPIELRETAVDLKSLPPAGDFYDNVHDVLRGDARPGVPLDQVIEVHRIIDVALSRGVADWREEPLREQSGQA
jgi:predicted dehydrogenase